jgi:hypothetical protein
VKRVRASLLTYDASEGRILPGEDYLVDDDKAERWITAGIAVIAPERPTAPAEPEDEGDEEPEPPVDVPPHDPDLAADVRKLFDAGHSERSIAQQLGISRPHVHTLLQN